MKVAKNLKEFSNYVMRYVGSGYKYYKIVSIPTEKVAKKPEIVLKIQNYYKTVKRSAKLGS